VSRNFGKAPVMSAYFFKKTYKFAVGFLTLLFMALWPFFCIPAWAEELSDETIGPVIFIDPGHGGNDSGARGASNLSEKDVVLALAKLMATDWTGKSNPILSRNDDYSVDLFHRTETANFRKARLFISLHAGGSFSTKAEGITIYYFLDSPGRLLPEDPTSKQAFNLNSGQIPWHSVQYRHTSESRSLARFIQTALAVKVGSVNCRLRGAPLLALSAANMPAVLIEVGNLNNPVEENNLGKPEYLSSLAGAIRKGIDHYLNKTHDISSIDLHE
jgi:N-acetylmuramoyl-L-alanine amidase